MVHPTTNKGTCEFETQTDSIIRDQIVASCLSNKLRRKLLQVSNISLEDTLKIGRSLETAHLQATAIEDNENQETTLLPQLAALRHYVSITTVDIRMWRSLQQSRQLPWSLVCAVTLRAMAYRRKLSQTTPRPSVPPVLGTSWMNLGSSTGETPQR